MSDGRLGYTSLPYLCTSVYWLASILLVIYCYIQCMWCMWYVCILIVLYCVYFYICYVY